MLSEQQQRIMGYFIEEAKDHLNTIEQGLINLQATIEDQEMVNEVFRAAHSVKGGAAMLGLNSIQNVSHRLEDYFKVLKECPVKIPQTLETLFLKVFDVLQELLEQLQGPFGLTEEKGNEIMGGVELVFQELGHQLNLLVSQSGGALPEDVSLSFHDTGYSAPSAPPVSVPPVPVSSEEDSALLLVFQSDVPVQLRDMLQLFKQTESTESRQQIQDLCQRMAKVGESFDLHNWTSMLNRAERAIANPENSYRILAPVIIKDIKQAQELVISGRSGDVALSPALLSLVPAAEPIADTSGLDGDLADLLSSIQSDDSEEISFSGFSLPEESAVATNRVASDAGNDDWFMGGTSDLKADLTTNLTTNSSDPDPSEFSLDFAVAESGAAGDRNSNAAILDFDFDKATSVRDTAVLSDDLDLDFGDTASATSPVTDDLDLGFGDTTATAHTDSSDDLDLGFDSNAATDDFSLDFGDVASSAPVATPVVNYAYDATDALDLSLIDDIGDRIDEVDDQNGPEVGADELNSLADLFDGDLADLDLPWDSEESTNAGIDASEILSESLDPSEDSSDFSDLLFDADATSKTRLEDDSDDISGLLNQKSGAASTSQSAERKVSSELDDFLDMDLSAIALDKTEDACAFLESEEAAVEMNPLDDFDLSVQQELGQQDSDVADISNADAAEADISDADLLFGTFDSDAGSDLQPSTAAATADDDLLFSEIDAVDSSFAGTHETSEATESFSLDGLTSDQGADQGADFNSIHSTHSTDEADDLFNTLDSSSLESNVLEFDDLDASASDSDLTFDGFDPLEANGSSAESLTFDGLDLDRLDSDGLDSDLTFDELADSRSEPDSLGFDALELDGLSGSVSDELASSGLDLAFNTDQNTDQNADQNADQMDLGFELDGAATLKLDDLNSGASFLDSFTAADLAPTEMATTSDAEMAIAELSASEAETDAWADLSPDQVEPLDLDQTDFSLDSLALTTDELTTETTFDAAFGESAGFDPASHDLSSDLSDLTNSNNPFGESFDLDVELPSLDSNIVQIESSELFIEEELDLSGSVSFDLTSEELSGELSDELNLEAANLSADAEPISDETWSFEDVPPQSRPQSQNYSAASEDFFATESGEISPDHSHSLNFSADDLLSSTPPGAEPISEVLSFVDHATTSEWTDLAADAGLDLSFDDPLNGLEGVAIADTENLFILEDSENEAAQVADVSSSINLDSLDLDSTSNPAETTETNISSDAPDSGFSFLNGLEEGSDTPDSGFSFLNGLEEDSNDTSGFNFLSNMEPDPDEPARPEPSVRGASQREETSIDPAIDFGSLESLLSENASTPVAPAANITTDTDFSDLDALLDEPAPAAPAAANDFSDLDALLDSPPPTSHPPLPIPHSPPPSTKSKADDEFSDLEALLHDADQALPGPAASANRRAPRRSGAMSDQTMRVSVKHLDNLNNLVGEMVVNRNSLEQSQERMRQFLDNLLYQVQQLSDVGQRMRDLYERSLLESSLLSSRRSYQLSSQNNSLATSGFNPVSSANHATGASFDALEMDRFTGFHTLSQEMIELIVRVRESSSDIEFVVEESDQTTRNFRQVTTQLQEGLTRARMVPFTQTADRLPRGVRDNALKYGKQAELLVEGRDTLIDKMIVEQLYDPMTHLVNNAVAHGIETSEERVASGKAPVGKIIVRAFHQGNQTIISVSDDGAGIDPERIKLKAIAKGILTEAQAQQMTRLDCYDLLFHHGFSTADQVDDIKGRGVGLDVVRSKLNEIRGAITIDSTIGKGSSFTIRLPLTLSISKALCCVSNRARIAFPMDGVEDMLDVPKDRVQKDSEGRPCIYWRDELLSFQSVAELLKHSRTIGRGSVYGGSQDEDIISVVVLRCSGGFLALQVDQVLGEQEIVIKQLEAPVPKPIGIAGATILGDGRIMPIADILELADLSQGRIRRETTNSLWAAELPPEDFSEKTDPTVLIVDDSITVRELLSMTFNKVGYRVEQARDGQEAWEKLRSGLPCDLVFCDIEMPRMDGLELLSRMQKDPTLSQLPIAMLTSRGADRHRQMAVQLGAKGYFTKPYLEEALLDAAQRMLKGEVLVTAGKV